MDWLTTYEALKNVYADGAYSNIAINEAISHHQGCQSSFVRSFTKGVIRDTRLLDYYIDTLAANGLKGIKTRTLIILRMGIFAIKSLDSVPDYAACNEAVKLSRIVSKGTDKFINAILRNYARQKNELKEPEKLAIKYSFNEDIVKLLQSQYEDNIENLLHALNTPTALTIRARNNREELIEELRLIGVEADADSETKKAIICYGGNLISTDAYKNGKFSIQSLSSIIAIEKLNPSKGSMVLDMCAAPGGKTTAMAELMDDTGKIVACDVYDHRLDLINKSAERLRLNCISTKLLDGTVYDAELDSCFDYVLADVPCSGLGVVPTKPEIKLKSNYYDLNDLIETQYRILKNAIRYVKPGGLIEYSTCTLNKNENEGVVNRVIEEDSLLEIVENRTIMPYNNKIGFFYCILRKNA